MTCLTTLLKLPQPRAGLSLVPMYRGKKLRDQTEKKLEWAPRAGEKGKQEMVTPLGNWELVPPYLVDFEATASSTGEQGVCVRGGGEHDT